MATLEAQMALGLAWQRTEQRIVLRGRGVLIVVCGQQPAAGAVQLGVPDSFGVRWEWPSR
jgi:hypothetical protein